jgi:hypothetical protein
VYNPVFNDVVGEVVSTVVVRISFRSENKDFGSLLVFRSFGEMVLNNYFLTRPLL